RLVEAGLSLCPRCGAALAGHAGGLDGLRSPDLSGALASGPTGNDSLAGFGGSRVVLHGRYQVLDTLGAGGMGTVYRANDLQGWQHVALKVLDAELVAHPSARRRMEQEASAMCRVNHPNVVRLLDTFDHGGQLVLVLELVGGGTLGHHIGQAGLPEEQVVPWMCGILAGLQAIHEAGLVHRDIKPDNVLLTETGVPKLADLGVAREMRPGQNRMETRLGARIGTAAYMSPEQVQGLPVDARSDLFSAGILAFEMVTGQRAFDAPSESEVMAAIVREEPALELLEDCCSDELRDVIAQALAKHPDDRFASAWAMSRALQSV
ncbi:MAG: serine/threonine-protein kinase, partial [Myxococcota bacterium]